MSPLKKLTPVLIVDAIEPCLPFWKERLGFEQVAEVPHEGALGFVILVRDEVEVMLQSRASVAADLPVALEGLRGHGAILYVTVADIEAAQAALDGLPLAVPRRRTFYGAEEVGVREPGGHLVVFAQHGSP